MKKYLAVFAITAMLLLSLFSLSGCQQCVHAHDVPYIYYTSHCMSYNSNGTCVVNVPIANHGYQSHCDEWQSDK